MRRPPRPEAFLGRLPLFADLPADVLARLAAATTRRELARGETLFREGEPSTGVHVLVYGRIELRHRGPDGRTRLVDVVEPGHSFGEPVMFLEKPYIVSAVALADSLLLHVAREAIFAELRHNERFAARIIGTLAQRVERLVGELQDQALGSGARRFVGWLLRQPMQAGPAQGAVVTLPATKRAIAARLNLSAEHLSRVLRELTAAQLLVVRGREVAIPDVERLRTWQLHGEGLPT
jgi:CRP-like cAMP-binding protein